MRNIPQLKLTHIGLSLGVATILLTGCASGGAAYKPIIDGPTGTAYKADLDQCQNLAETKSYDNSDTRTGAAIGAGLGGLIALADSDSGTGDVVGGAIIGALFGGGEAAFKTRKDRKNIVLNCMAGRGHNVVG